MSHLLHLFPTFGGGGSQARTCQLIGALGPEWAHTILSLDGDLSSAERLPRRPGIRAFAAPSGVRGRFPWRSMLRLLREHAPDLVATYNWGAMDGVLAARCLGLPVLHHEDGFNPDEMGGQKLRRIWARRLLLPGVHRVIVPSRTLEAIARDRWRLPSDRLLQISNGIDLQRFRPGSAEELRRQIGIGPRVPLVGAVGRLDPVKNLSMLLRAIGTANNELPVSLVILGDGPERSALESLAESLHIADRVYFIGRVDDPAPWYRALDVFAMSSRTEQMPVAALEAMATGLPVLATDAGDTRQMVAAGNREMIVDPKDSRGYVDALVRLLQRGPLRHAVGSANRERVVERYDQNRMIELHGRLWESAAGRGRAVTPRAA